MGVQQGTHLAELHPSITKGEHEEPQIHRSLAGMLEAVKWALLVILRMAFGLHKSVLGVGVGVSCAVN